MAGYVGAKMEIAFTKETVRGTAASPASGDWRPHEGFDFGPVIEKTENVQAIGSIVGRISSAITKEYSQGSVPMVAALDFLGDLNNMIMGAAPSSAGSDPYTHSWTLTNTNEHVSYTVSVIDPIAGDKQYANAMLNTCSVEATTDDYVKLTLDLMAGKEAAGSVSSSYTTPCANLFAPDTVALYFADDYDGLAAASAVDVKGINLNFNKNVDSDWVLGTTESADFINQRMTINGDFTFKYDSTTYRTLGLAETNKAFKIVMTSGDYSWTIVLPSVDFQDWSRGNDNDAYMTNTVGFNANFCDQTNGFVKTTVVDNHATH